MLVRCHRCKGHMKYVGLGSMIQRCTECEGGYQTVKQAVTPAQEEQKQEYLAGGLSDRKRNKKEVIANDQA